MNCRDLEELLSAYADGELSRTQREFVEEHLSGCADCRATLAEFEAAGRKLASLRETPASPDISKSTLSKIKTTKALPDKSYRRWLRPVTAAVAIVAVIAVMLVAQPWNLESSEAMAASIVRNSPEVHAALDDEEIKEVEVTTKVVDEQNNVLMVLVRTEERAIAAEVNLETKKVTEIVRVEVPDFQPGDERKAIDIAGADPRVQDILAKGGTISEVHLGYSLAGETVIPTALLTIEQDKYDWNIAVDFQKGEVASIGRSQPSAAMIVVHISRFVTRFVAPVLLFLGILLVSGLSFGFRRAKTIAGTAALVLGIIGLFMALYSLSSIWWRLVLSVGIPAVGFIIGIADLRQRGRRRWMPITGIVLGSLALLLVFLNVIMLNINNVPGENIFAIIGMAVVIAGIIAYAFKEQIMSIHISGRWLRPAVVALAAVVVLIVALVQPWSVNPEGVIARAYSATEGLLSYRATMSGTASEGGNLNSTIEFVFPDRFRVRLTSGGETDEFIVVGDKQYVKSGDMSRNTIIAFSNSASSMLSKEATLKLIDSLTDIETLPDGKIKGVDSFHYKGKYDMEKQLEDQKARLTEMQSRMDADDYARMMEGLEDSLNVKMEIELWIGKDDNLIRQIVQTTQYPDDEGKLQTSSATMTFYDFNEPIVIEPPLDANGELLEGWQLAGSIGSNEQVFSRNITTSIGSQEGYDDWEHQEVKYTITITNNSIEAVRDVRVTIATKLLEDERKPMVAAEPETPADVIAPGESRTFHARIPFDASGYTKEEILKLQDVTTFLVDYTTEDGKERTQLLYPNAPYPTKTPPPTPPAD
jgi:outer membrane lipoprotein-sorting protein